MPLSEPPRDANGVVVPHDHTGIADADRIIRRISDEHVVSDAKAPGGRRVSTLAFQSSTDGNCGMSVDLESSIVEAGLMLQALLRAQDSWARSGSMPRT